MRARILLYQRLTIFSVESPFFLAPTLALQQFAVPKASCQWAWLWTQNKQRFGRKSSCSKPQINHESRVTRRDARAVFRWESDLTDGLAISGDTQHVTQLYFTGLWLL